MWTGRPGATALRIEYSSFFNPCFPDNEVWPTNAFAVLDYEESDFTPRSPVSLSMCWE
jgi:hypothetical protein